MRGGMRVVKRAVIRGGTRGEIRGNPQRTLPCKFEPMASGSAFTSRPFQEKRKGRGGGGGVLARKSQCQ